MVVRPSRVDTTTLFHAYYGDDSAIIDIETMQIIGGSLAPRVHRLIVRWTNRRQSALRENWRRAMEHEPLLWIDPDE